MLYIYSHQQRERRYIMVLVSIVLEKIGQRPVIVSRGLSILEAKRALKIAAKETNTVFDRKNNIVKYNNYTLRLV